MAKLSSLDYTSIKLGNATLRVDTNNNIDLWVNGQNFMGLDNDTLWQAKEFVIENSLAHGTCVTTGLGLGFIQLQLIQNPKVKHVIVYEKSQDVIDIFRSFTDKSDVDISKLTIINQDADCIEGLKVDCIFLDHFAEAFQEQVVPLVQKFCQKNTADKIWYWPAAFHFLMYSGQNNLDIDLDSYRQWKHDAELNFLAELDLSHIENIQSLSFLYKNHTKNYIYGETLNNLDKKRELISIFQKKDHGKTGT